MELIRWNKAKQAIIEAKTIDEVKDIRDKAQAMKAYAKQIGESLEVQNDIAEIKIRAERRAGEILQETERNPGIKMAGGNIVLPPEDAPPKLEDIGITKIQSSRWQATASLPEEVFEKHIIETKCDGKELTSSGVLKIALKEKRAQEIKETTEKIEAGIDLPEGKFEVVVIDPPWPYGVKYDSDGRRVSSPYPEMSLEEIGNINIPMADDSSMWLWTTHKFLRDSFDIMENWGFSYKATLVWNKEKLGIGHWIRMQAEFCLLGIKGSPVWNMTNERDIITEARREHSRKPEAFYNMVETLCIGRKLDYFSRAERFGWYSFGSELNKYELGR